MNWYGRIKLSKKQKDDHHLSCVMVKFEDNIAQKIKKWSKDNIEDNMLHHFPSGSGGRENDIHITVFYGLHSDKAKDVEDLIENSGEIEVELGETSSFRTSEDFDVLFVKVKSQLANREIQSCKPICFSFRQLTDSNLDKTITHPHYTPHLTIAYLKKGFIDNFVGLNDFEGLSATFDKVHFSNSDDQSTTIDITH